MVQQIAAPRGGGTDRSLTHATTWAALQRLTLVGKSQFPKFTRCVTPFMGLSQNDGILDMGNRCVAAGVQGCDGERACCAGAAEGTPC